MGAIRRKTMVFVAAFIMGSLTGIAYAAGHTTGGIYHGTYFEFRDGPDYHHSWTEHGHTGYRFVAIDTPGEVRKCTTNNIADGSNLGTVHIHCTTYFENKGHGHFSTWRGTPPCTGEATYPTYSDGHGICDHRMGE